MPSIFSLLHITQLRSHLVYIIIYVAGFVVVIELVYPRRRRLFWSEREAIAIVAGSVMPQHNVGEDFTRVASINKNYECLRHHR